MSKAKQVINLVNEQLGHPIISADDIKINMPVIYKEGTEFAGMMGYVVQFDTAAKTIDLKFGNSARVGVPWADLLIVPSVQTGPVPIK